VNNQKRELPQKEKRLSPKEFEDALVRLEKSAPDIVDEDEFRRRLRETTIHRYEVALELIKDVEDLLLNMSNSDDSSEKGLPSKEELDFALEEIDHAVVQMTHASLAFNKAATSSAGIRNILMVTREDDDSTIEQRMAAILGEEYSETGKKE
jgi:hypothetical protein